jgi:hypothetical protein
VAQFLIGAAEKEIRALGASTPDGRRQLAKILVVLQQIKSDARLVSNLTAHGYGENDPNSAFSVKRWEAAYRGRPPRNLYRLKVRGGGAYRVIYAYHPREDSYYALGIVHHDFNYDTNSADGRRIIAAYDQLGIPLY